MDCDATTPDNGLSDEVKRQLKSIVLELRHLFEDDLAVGFKRLGIDTEKGRVAEADSLSHLTHDERDVRRVLDAVLAKEAAMTKDVPEAIRALLREAAYTHLNRLIGLKCLELRGHLSIDGERTEVITPRSEYADLPRYLWILRSREARLVGDPELLWRRGLQRACEVASAELGVLFDPDDPYAQVWPSHAALMHAVETLTELPESAFRADELLGWVYQYFQSEEKDRVFEEVRTKKKKIAWADIVPVTQLYTERYMVDFLLQNSLGARWMEMYPDSTAKEAWPYYVEPATPHSRERQPVKEWTILDPCCGSGHFLVVAFDLLVQLYAEERALAERGVVPADWAVPEEEVARMILERNLHGIDIDPRAVQLSALALYLKAKEHGLVGTPTMNLVIADCVLQRGEHYQALLNAYSDDPAATEAIKAIWSALENVRELGSLVRIEEEVEAAVTKTRKRVAGSFADLDTDWAVYTAELIARLRDAFGVETSSRDERLRLFGAEATKGLGLFELLSGRYDVVCTNPPYMGVGNMGPALKEYVRANYEPGRRDLYAAFVVRCWSLSSPDGHVAMVTQQSWMFLSRFEPIRRQDGPLSSRVFGGLLQSSRIAVLAHLGARAFDELSGEIVNVALLVCQRSTPSSNWRFRVVRATDGDSGARKRDALVECTASSPHVSSRMFTVSQAELLSLPGGPLLYHLPDGLLATFINSRRVKDALTVREGLHTSNSDRFVRFAWECAWPNARWFPLAKGGGYSRWAGYEHWVVDWENNGERIKATGEAIIPSEKLYFTVGLTYSLIGQGVFSVRRLADSVFDSAGHGVFAESQEVLMVAAGVMNSHPFTLFVRSLSPTLRFNKGYVENTPVPELLGQGSSIASYSAWCIEAKAQLCSRDLTQRSFYCTALEGRGLGSPEMWPMDDILTAALLHAVEGAIETDVAAAYELSVEDLDVVRRETGWPVGWYPLLVGYDLIPEVSSRLPATPGGLHNHIARHERRTMLAGELEDLRARLRHAYVAGPGATDSSAERAAADSEDGLEVGAFIPLPPDTFLEELSREAETHPISVYWLLKELIAKEGLVCPPETKRYAEDWLSVKLLRMLGHRWPMQSQNEAAEGKPFMDPKWVDADGVVALTAGMGEEALDERFRRFFDAEFGVDKGHDVEQQLAQALGWKRGTEWGKQKPLSLERWFERDFFKRHVTQFKRRPIAWHLRSPKGTVNVIVYYQKFNRDRLALLRARYIENLRRDLAGELEAANRKGFDDPANLARIEQLEGRLADLSAFDAKLAELQEGRTREARIWCPWKTPEEQPHGWDPDINDGVRVNIAPVQRLGLLAADVLNKKDLNSLLAPEARA